MKRFLILFLFFIGFSVSFAQAFQFETSEIDYGTIRSGDDGLREFKFKNIGDAPLIITNIGSSCGCTVPEWSKDPIAPGASGSIKVRYDTNRRGPIRKTITVYSNAKDAPQIGLSIKGTVQ